MSWLPVPRGARRWRTEFCFCFSRAEPPSDFPVWCALPTCPLVRPGSRVSCEWRKSESAFLGTVKKVNDDGSFDVLYDDGRCGDSVCMFSPAAYYLVESQTAVARRVPSARHHVAALRMNLIAVNMVSLGVVGGGVAVGWHRSVDVPVPLGSIKAWNSPKAPNHVFGCSRARTPPCSTRTR